MHRHLAISLDGTLKFWPPSCSRDLSWCGGNACTNHRSVESSYFRYSPMLQNQITQATRFVCPKNCVHLMTLALIVFPYFYSDVCELTLYKVSCGAGEMAQQLKAHAPYPGIPSSNPGTCKAEEHL